MAEKDARIDPSGWSVNQKLLWDTFQHRIAVVVDAEGRAPTFSAALRIAVEASRDLFPDMAQAERLALVQFVVEQTMQALGLLYGDTDGHG